MIKLARNSLADKGAFKINNSIIEWQYIKALSNLQSNIGIRFANKLISLHLNYRNNIMKVRLAVQTLSSGAADAIEYLKNRRDMQFQGIESTIYLIRQIDRLFDILNSRISFSKGFKSPINSGNIKSIESVFDSTTEYLKILMIEERPIYTHARKMFVVGFITSMKSTLEISYKLLYKYQNSLKFVLTYKLSQDHLELFFACVRSKGGCNNIPNCYQFKNTLRQLLFTKDITVQNGNCCDFGASDSEILEFRSKKET